MLRAADISAIDVVGIAESHCVKEAALDALVRLVRTRVLDLLSDLRRARRAARVEWTSPAWNSSIRMRHSASTKRKRHTYSRFDDMDDDLSDSDED